MGRTKHDTRKLKEEAERLLAGQDNLKIDDYETTGDNIVYITGGSKPGDVCKVMIDRKSGSHTGRVTIGGRPAIYTGPELSGADYQLEDIGDEEICMIWGSCTVLYIKRR